MGVLDTGALTSALQNKDTDEELSGALEAVLQTALSPAQALKYTGVLINEGGFNTSEEERATQRLEGLSTLQRN